MHRPVLERLESRDLFAAVEAIYSPNVAESEPNNDVRHADSIPRAYDGVTRITGELKDKRDRDVYRFTAWSDGHMKVSLEQRGGGKAAVIVESADGDAIVKRTNSAREFSVRRGKQYVVRIVLDDGSSPSYRLLMKQNGLDVSATRKKVLATGINVSSWFWNQVGSTDPYDVFENYFTERDAKLLKKAGIKNVRLPVDTQYFVDWNEPSKLNARSLAALDKAINLMTRNGLAVIVSPFGDYNDRVAWPNNEKNIVTFIHSWAGHLSKFDPEKVFLQTANEPAGDPSIWLPMQEQIVAEMRKRAPRHTILTSTTLRFASNPSDFGTIDALIGSTPLRDPNVVYGFHYYAPYVFTAQGADWAWPGYGNLRYVPYPSTPQNVEWLVNTLDAEITDPDHRFVIDTVRKYGEDYWNADAIAHELERVKTWSSKHGVTVMMDEFGAVAYTRISASDRNRWIHDTRAAVEKLGFGWAMWDYSAGYNLADGDWDSRTLRPDVLESLGLKR